MAARVSNHPVLLHKLTKLRDATTTPHEFRQLLKELTFYLGYETTSSLNCEPLPYKVGAMLEVCPYAHVHHLGMYREKDSLVPILYYNRLPAEVDSDIAIVLEPMIATAGTVNASLTILKEWGVKRIKVIAIIASKQGLQSLHKTHPDVEVHVAAVDEKLSEQSYILPGLGDVGDRLWSTTKNSIPVGDPTTPSAGAGAGAGAGSDRGAKRARQE